MKTRLFTPLPAALAVGFVTVAVYAQVFGADFVNYDDTGYVTDRIPVLGGLTWDSFRWAWTTFEFANWHPLTWLSHMLDVEIYDTNPRGHHATSIVLHAANSSLLLLLLHRLTGSLWRSALVALLFGLHPVQVESVAWISERKNVLSMFFGLLALLSYATYGRRPRVLPFVGALIAFVLSLLAKPMLVTLPCIFLLLDVWPLERFQMSFRVVARLVSEKIPFFALAVGSSVVTIIAQSRGGTVISADDLSVLGRIANASVSYVEYIGSFLWPVGLAVYYPHALSSAGLLVGGCSALLLVGVSVIVVFQLRRRPYLAVGWFWFLGSLVPMIGVVQAGLQSRADRYMYFSIIGLAIMLSFSLPAKLFVGRDSSMRVVRVIVCALLVAMSTLTVLQTRVWQNSGTLFSHAARVAPSALAYQNLGAYYLNEGELERAEGLLRQAIAAYPLEQDPYRGSVAHCGVALASLLETQGRVAEAESQLETVIRNFPSFWEAYRTLGAIRIGDGRHAQAIAPLEHAVRLKSSDDKALHMLGLAYQETGNLEEALYAFRTATEIQPFDGNHWIDLGVAYAQLERYEESDAAFARAHSMHELSYGVNYNYGYLRILQGRFEEARDFYRVAVAADPNQLDAAFELGQVELLLGDLVAAREHLQRAYAIDPTHAPTLALLAQFEEQGIVAPEE